MHERIVEILLLLMDELQEKKRLGDIDVASLARHGYTPTEISSAFSWLFDRLEGGQPPPERFRPASAGSVRLLHPAEQAVITTDGYGYLLQCHQLGLLSLEDVETIIERAMMAGFSSVSAHEVKALVAGMLFDSDRSTGGSPTDTIH